MNIFHSLTYYRGQALMASGELHKFLDAMRKAEIWAVDALSRLTTAESPRSVTDADAFIARHVEKLAEIDGRQVLLIIYVFCGKKKSLLSTSF